MIHHIKKVSALVLVSYFGSILSIPIPSYAIMAPSGTPSNLKYQVQCDNFCPQFGKKGSVGGLASGSIWSDPDDALCAALGSPTSSSYSTSTPLPSPVASATINYSDCNITIPQLLVDKYGSTFNSSADACSKAGKFKDHCSYHNSQVETYCMSYNAIADHESGAYSLNGTLLAVDTVAAATCLAACISNMPWAQVACGVVGAAVGAADLGTMITQSTGAAAEFIQTQDYIGGAVGGLGAAGGVANVLQGGKRWNTNGATGSGAASTREIEASTKKLSELKDAAEEASKDVAKKTADLRAAPPGSEAEKLAKTELDSAIKKSDKAAAEVTKQSEELAELSGKESADKIGRAMACVEAGVFAVLVGIRTYNLATMKNLKDDSCNKVNGLMSNAPGTGGSTGGGNPPNSVSAGGDQSTSPPGGNGGNTGAITTPDQSSYDSYDRCVQSGSSRSDCWKAVTGSQQSNGATDANLLSNPDAVSKLLQNAPSLGDIVRKAQSAGAGAAMAGTLPAGDASNALAHLADYAQKNGAELGNLLGVGAGAAYSSGGGGGSSGSKSSDNPFGSIFGAGAGSSAAAGGGTNLTTFGNAPGAPDIWHTGTSLNIFEIVSEKMTKVSNRISIK